MSYHWKKDTRVLIFRLLMLILLFAVACGSSAEPVVVEKEVIKEVVKEVPVVKEVIKEVPKEVIIEKEVVKEVVKQVVVIATAVPQASSPQSSKPKGVLRIALDEIGPPKWIPKLQGAPQNSINNTTFWESLWKNQKSTGLTGVLAESWEISPDSTVWTIRLHQGVPFHHGYGEMTVHDFVFSMENSVEKGTSRSPKLLKRHFFPEGGGMTVVDDHTFQVDTVVPAWSLPWDVATGMDNYMGTGVISKKYYDEQGEEKAGYTKAVGTGPWRSAKHTAGGTWRFEAVENHWRKTPNFTELHYIEISEESTRLANFLAGKLDTGTFNLESIAQIEKDCQKCKFKTFATGAQLFLNIHGNVYIDRPDLATPRNAELPWISSNPDTNSDEWAKARKVRKAMAIAIDRQLLVDTLLRGKGAPAHVYGWTGFEDRMGYLADLKHEFNPELAKQLLAEAGYPNGIEVPMALTNRPYPATIETAAAVATMWEDVGIRTTQIRQPMSAFRPNFVKRSWEGVNSHGNNVSSEPLLSRTTTFHTEGVINYGVEHQIAEELTERISAAFVQEERLELVRQLTKFLYDEVLTIPTVSVYHVWPLGPEIDEWEWTFPVVRVPSNLEFIPHRR